MQNVLDHFPHRENSRARNPNLNFHHEFHSKDMCDVLRPHYAVNLKEHFDVLLKI